MLVFKQFLKLAGSLVISDNAPNYNDTSYLKWLLKGPACLSCSVLSVLQIWAVKAGISIDWPACLVTPSASSARLPGHSACLIGPPAWSLSLPHRPACLVTQPASSAHLPCTPDCLVFWPLALVEGGYFALSNLLYLDICGKIELENILPGRTRKWPIGKRGKKGQTEWCKKLKQRR